MSQTILIRIPGKASVTSWIMRSFVYYFWSRGYQPVVVPSGGKLGYFDSSLHDYVIECPDHLLHKVIDKTRPDRIITHYPDNIPLQAWVPKNIPCDCFLDESYIVHHYKELKKLTELSGACRWLVSSKTIERILRKDFEDQQICYIPIYPYFRYSITEKIIDPDKIGVILSISTDSIKDRNTLQAAVQISQEIATDDRIWVTILVEPNLPLELVNLLSTLANKSTGKIEAVSINHPAQQVHALFQHDVCLVISVYPVSQWWGNMAILSGTPPIIPHYVATYDGFQDGENCLVVKTDMIRSDPIPKYSIDVQQWINKVYWCMNNLETIDNISCKGQDFYDKMRRQFESIAGYIWK